MKRLLQKYRQHADAGYALFCFTYYSVLLDLSVLINRIYILPGLMLHLCSLHLS